MTHGNALLQQLGITGFTFGQNGGYNGNCTTDFTGPEELDRYWYHPDHLGSSSFITGIDGEVNQNIEYFPSGETFVENHLNSYNTPYKFNSKELDDETGYYYYGARYYNPRVSLWLNVDPLASYDPIMNTEHYINGQHNGGVYNSGNLNPYIYTYNSPIMFIDPNGKQTFAVYEPVNYTTIRQLAIANGFDKRVTSNKFYNVKSKGLALIATYEGLSLKMYDQDGARPGNATIGFGHLIHKGLIDGRASEKPYENGIELSEAINLFGERIEEHEGYINTYMKRYDISLNADQFAAMVDLSFNKGPDDALDIMKIYKEKGLNAAGDAIMDLNKKNAGLQKRRRFQKELFVNSKAYTKTGLENLIKEENEKAKSNNKTKK